MTITLSDTARARLGHVADAIEARPERFDMGVWFNRTTQLIKHNVLVEERDCGTAGCVAGWILSEFLPDDELIAQSTANHINIPTRAIQLLELDEDDSEDEIRELFTDRRWWMDHNYVGHFIDADGHIDDEYDGLEDITPEIAVTALRDLAAGEWS